jgi:hypothetical protein
LRFKHSTNPAKAETTIQKNMPKTFYANETDIPENQKGSYVQKNGRWELTDLDDEHPTIKTKQSLETTQTELKNQISSLTAEKGNLERERDEAKAKSVPHGFRAVKADVAELGETVKQSGLTKEQFIALKTENDAFKAEKAETEGLKLRQEAGAFLGYQNTEAFAQLATKLPIEKSTDGKFVVKDGDVLKPLTKELVEQHTAFTPFLASLSAKPSVTPFPESGTPQTGDIFSQIRAEVKQQQSQPKANIDQRFGVANAN